MFISRWMDKEAVSIYIKEYSVQFSRSVVSDSLRPHESEHARPPCPSPTPRVHSNSRPSSWWCYPVISSSVVPFSSCPQSLPASGSFPMSQLFTWGGQSTGVSALASVLPKNTQDWSLEWTSWISLQSKGLSRVFSNTTVQKHQFCLCASTILSWWLWLCRSLKSGRLIPPVPFFFLKIALAIRVFLYFHTNCEMIHSSSLKNTVGSLIGIALNL